MPADFIFDFVVSEVIVSILPFMSIPAYFFAVCFLLIDKTDEFQLLFFILQIRGFQFVSDGLINVSWHMVKHGETAGKQSSVVGDVDEPNLLAICMSNEREYIYIYSFIQYTVLTYIYILCTCFCYTSASGIPWLCMAMTVLEALIRPCAVGPMLVPQIAQTVDPVKEISTPYDWSITNCLRFISDTFRASLP
jgi:hypothetical protein